MTRERLKHIGEISNLWGQGIAQMKVKIKASKMKKARKTELVTMLDSIPVDIKKGLFDLYLAYCSYVYRYHQL